MPGPKHNLDPIAGSEIKEDIILKNNNLETYFY